MHFPTKLTALFDQRLGKQTKYIERSLLRKPLWAVVLVGMLAFASLGFECWWDLHSSIIKNLIYTDSWSSMEISILVVDFFAIMLRFGLLFWLLYGYLRPGAIFMLEDRLFIIWDGTRSETMVPLQDIRAMHHREPFLQFFVLVLTGLCVVLGGICWSAFNTGGIYTHEFLTFIGMLIAPIVSMICFAVICVKMGLRWTSFLDIQLHANKKYTISSSLISYDFFDSLLALKAIGESNESESDA